MNFKQRKEKIEGYLKTYASISNQEAQVLTGAHRNTLTHDFQKMLQAGLLLKSGRGKGTRYQLTGNVLFSAKILQPLWPRKRQGDLERYFKKSSRSAVFFERVAPQAFSASFAFEDHLVMALQRRQSDIERRRQALGEIERKRIKERLAIDLSWASARIEGSTYSLLETEALIKYQQTAHGKSLHEAQMILNHKLTLDYLRSSADYRKLSKHKVFALHQLLIQGLGVETGFRKHLVKISNSSLVPCDNEFQIASWFEKMLSVINACEQILAKAVAANLLLAFLQPFGDGNKRTARMLGNGILLAHGLLPVSFSRTPKEAYIKSVLTFYEKQDPSYFKFLFLNELNHSFLEYIG